MIAILIAVLAALIALLGYLRTRDRRRSKSLERHSKSWGCSFARENPFLDIAPSVTRNTSIWDSHPDNKLVEMIELWLKNPAVASFYGQRPTEAFPFMQRTNVLINNVLWSADDNVAYRIFDLTFKNTDNVDLNERFTSLLVNINGSWPGTHLSHRTDLSRLRNDDSMVDVDIPSLSFAEEFHVQSMDPTFARKLFNESVRETVSSSTKMVTDIYLDGTWMLVVGNYMRKASDWNKWRSFARSFTAGIDESIATTYPVSPAIPMSSGERELVR